MKRRLVAVPSVLILVLLPGFAGAQTAKGGPMAKLHQSLVTLHEQHTAHLARGGALPFSSVDPLVRLVDDRVVVDAVASGDANVLKSDLESLGMQGAVAFGRIVSGQLPISALPIAAGLASLRFAQSATAMAGTGSVTSQGDLAMRANVARSTFGVDGTGVGVGVLSDSFNCLGGAPADVASGDLPVVTVIQEASPCSGTIDEGRAMLQIVHDVAPGANLSFASAFNGMASFAANIRALAAAGAKIVTDDILYFAEPFFQDGIIAQAVDSVVAGGVAYFVIAGNDGRLAYDHAFVPGLVYTAGQIPTARGAGFFFGGTAHNFNPGGLEDDFQRVTIGAYTTAIIALQWDSPFFSAGGVGAQNDVDVYVLNANNTQVVLALTTDNIASGDAVEFGTIVNNGSTPIDLNIMIVNYAGPNPGRIKYKMFQTPNITIDEYATNSGTIAGHENAKGAETIGAAWYAQTPAFGISPPVTEYYSSSGTTPILFDVAGNRLATPDPRTKKPGIVAPDGVVTTFPLGSGLNPFFGTSAAAPHAAAVAALLLQSRPSLTPTQVYAALEGTAIDMGLAGFDNDTGFGLVQADAALAAVQSPATIFAADLPSSRSVQVGGVATAFGIIVNAGSGTATGCGISPISGIPAIFGFQTTNAATNQVTGAPNIPVGIAAGANQSYVFSFTPTAPFPPTDVQLSFNCANGSPAPIQAGLNTLLLSASTMPVPDIIALVATPTDPGIADIPGATGTGYFTVATVNVGAGGAITASADTGGTSLPVNLTLCQTNPVNSVCFAPPTSSVTTQINAKGTPTFAVFVAGTGPVPFDPVNNRIFVRFKDAGSVTRGATSVAVRTQ